MSIERIEELLRSAVDFEPTGAPPDDFERRALARAARPAAPRARLVRLVAACGCVVIAVLAGSRALRSSPPAKEPRVALAVPSVDVQHGSQRAGKSSVPAATKQRLQPKHAPATQRDEPRRAFRYRPRPKRMLARAHWSVQTVHSFESDLVAPVWIARTDEQGQEHLEPAIITVPLEGGVALTPGHSGLSEAAFREVPEK